MNAVSCLQESDDSGKCPTGAHYASVVSMVIGRWSALCCWSVVSMNDGHWSLECIMLLVTGLMECMMISGHWSAAVGWVSTA